MELSGMLSSPSEFHIYVHNIETSSNIERDSEMISWQSKISLSLSNSLVYAHRFKLVPGCGAANLNVWEKEV